jgi:hypothetical protein
MSSRDATATGPHALNGSLIGVINSGFLFFCADAFY